MGRGQGLAVGGGAVQQLWEVVGFRDHPCYCPCGFIVCDSAVPRFFCGGGRGKAIVLIAWLVVVPIPARPLNTSPVSHGFAAATAVCAVALQACQHLPLPWALLPLRPTPLCHCCLFAKFC